MGKLFGTDGVRGVANRELTPQLAFEIGRAGAYVLTKGGEKPKMVLGKDTRQSGDLLEAALTAGICSVGVDVISIGVVSTPGLAYLTRYLKASAGVMISASHNPAEDNGIKFFTGEGFKLFGEIEDEIEAIILGDKAVLPVPTGGEVGIVSRQPEAVAAYIDYAVRSVPQGLQCLKVVVDCANGAASAIAPVIFEKLGADVIPIYHTPDGLNINVKCGSTHPEALQAAVIEHQADVGIAYDGDADRVIAVDEHGEIVDGDFIMAICANQMAKTGKLANNKFVTTVMTNMGLDTAMEAAGIGVLKSKVGDRYVLETMLQNGLNFGGEQSGHIIFLELNTTGDGIMTSLQLLDVMRNAAQPLSVLAKVMRRFPQVLTNVRVKDKAGYQSNAKIKEAVDTAEAAMQKKGRVLVRPSGTEPLIRVMLEGDDAAQLDYYAKQIADVIKAELG